MATQVEKLGLIYALTCDAAYARQAKAILTRFAEVYPNYSVHSGYHEFTNIDALVAAEHITALPVDELVVPPNRPNRQLHAGYWIAGRATGSGMEGTFLLPVTVAYDLVADATEADGTPIFTDAERLLVERDLLLEGTKLLLADNVINNKTISARTAVAAIGSAVGDAELVRWGLDGLHRTLAEWFLPDGATSESPAYGLMVLARLALRASNPTPIVIRRMAVSCSGLNISRSAMTPMPVVTSSEPPMMSGLPTATGTPRAKMTKVKISTSPMASPAKTANQTPRDVTLSSAPPRCK